MKDYQYVEQDKAQLVRLGIFKHHRGFIKTDVDKLIENVASVDCNLFHLPAINHYGRAELWILCSLRLLKLSLGLFPVYFD